MRDIVAYKQIMAYYRVLTLCDTQKNLKMDFFFALYGRNLETRFDLQFGSSHKLLKK